MPYITLSTENTQVLFINRCLAFIKIVAFYVQPHINAHFFNIHAGCGIFCGTFWMLRNTNR
ncbi:putative membrane protein [Vibrio cholerae HC-33A2]|nr:putative membrane protein [Vibrio cholerae HC-33A2]EKG93325.1 putative membrane protein [Vibrio cholerae HC-81A2]EMQ04182.1 putative membrane protein [Vibrio cholerae O1 str. AG-7404]EMQ14107.1 putative membrane protein [Vibrio cholerae O1 str. EC-0009]